MKLNKTVKTIVRFFCFLVFIAISGRSFAQLKGISYQAVAIDESSKQIPGLDNSGAALVEKTIGLRFTILNGSNGPIYYQETQITSTDKYGLFSVVIGDGTLTAQSTRSIISDIPWSTGNQFLRVELDLKDVGDFKIMSNQQFMAVPYAFYALNTNTNSAPPITLTVLGNSLNVSGGNTVVLPIAATASLVSSGAAVTTSLGSNSYSIHVPQPTLSIVNSNLSISGGNTVSLPAATPQTITAQGIASATNGINSATVTVPNPTLTISGTNLSVSGGNTITLPTAAAQTISALGIASVTNGINSATLSVPNPTLSIIGSNLSVSGGNTITLPSASPQTITTQGIATVTNGINSATVSVPNPTLTLNGNNLSVSGGNTVTIPTATIQAIVLNGNTLSVGPPSNSVNIAPLSPWVQTSGTVALSVSSNFVGIGTSNPNNLLHISSNSQNALLTIDGATQSLVRHSLAGITKGYVGYIAQGATGMGFMESTGTFARLLVTNLGQVGINTTSPTATLHVNGTTRLVDGTQGLGKVLTSDANGNASWQTVGSSSGWGLTGNAGTSTLTNFIGTTDNVKLSFKVNNQLSGLIDQTNGQTLFGYQAGALASPTVVGNTAFGSFALRLNAGLGNNAFGYQTLASNTTGSYNSGFGYYALIGNTSGSYNNAFGFYSLSSNTAGSYNTAFGSWSMPSNTGTGNSAFGAEALYSNTTGSDNHAFGFDALLLNTTGSNNHAFGFAALHDNTTGNFNNAFGYYALLRNTTSSHNNGFGYAALMNNTTAQQNIAIGNFALASQSYSNGGAPYFSDNIAIGHEALNSNQPSSTINGLQNVAVGTRALYTNVTGLLNTAIGYSANVTTSNLTNATALGAMALVSASNNMVFGNAAVIGWGFGVAAGTAALRVGSSASNGNGALLTTAGVWTNASDSTKKFNIKSINYGLKEVLTLRPVSYKMKGSNYQDIGFIAQEVKQILPELVYGKEGEMTLSYGQLTAVLTKAMQEQQLLIEKQKNDLERLEKYNEQLTTRLLKISQEIEVIKQALPEKK